MLDLTVETKKNKGHHYVNQNKTPILMMSLYVC